MYDLLRFRSARGVLVLASTLASALLSAQTGDLWAWGRNYAGSIGDGTNTDRLTPVQALIVDDAVQVAAGYWHALALKSDGTVWSWGNNGYGQLGHGTTGSSTSQNSPQQVMGLSDVVSIACGAWHSLAVKRDGSVWAWGANGYGQLGNGTTAISNRPHQVPNISNARSVAGGLEHSLLLKKDGSVWAWGNNFFGQLGNGSNDDRSSVPVQVQGLSSVIDISAGQHHSLAVLLNGTAWSWGHGQWGQLGNGNNVNVRAPVQVSGLTDIVQIAAGLNHSSARGVTGIMWTWGEGSGGQLGNGYHSGSQLTPVQVQGLHSVSQISARGDRCFAVGADGAVWGWGRNIYGELGVGDTIDRSRPTQIDLSEVSHIAAGWEFTVALRARNRPFYWMTFPFDEVAGGVKLVGTLHFSEALPSQRLIRMSDDSAHLLMSTYCILPANQSAANFDVWTYGVASPETVTIGASIGGITRFASLVLTPATLDILWLVPTSTVGGNPSIGNVRLLGKAPAGGVTVTLSTSNPAAANHAPSLLITHGSSLRQFPVSTFGVDFIQNVTISASFAGATRTAVVSVRPAALSSISLALSTVKGGTPVAATVTMTGKTGPLGRTVFLTSNNPNILVPGSVYVPPQKFAWSFTVLTQPVGATTTGTITATQGAIIRSATLTLTP